MNYIVAEAMMFIEACIIGMFFGVFYDLFRVIRICFKNPAILVFFEDLLYFLILAIISFIFVVVKNNGTLRAFLIIGELLGLIFYFFAISNPIINFLRKKVKIITSKFKNHLK